MKSVKQTDLTWVSPNGKWRAVVSHDNLCCHARVTGPKGIVHVNSILSDGMILRASHVVDKMPRYVLEAVDSMLIHEWNSYRRSSRAILGNRNPKYEKKATGKGSLYVAVDEKGNLGKSLHKESKPYFLEMGWEFKYYSDPDLREPIIKKAAPFVKDTYFARYHKDYKKHNDGLTKDEKVEQHMDMLCSTADAILKSSEFEYLDVDIDYNELVKEQSVERSFECSPNRDGRTVECHIRESKSNFGLMTNDFIVGAVGDSVNDPGNEEARELVDHLRRKPVEVYIKSGRWRRRK